MEPSELHRRSRNLQKFLEHGSIRDKTYMNLARALSSFLIEYNPVTKHRQLLRSHLQLMATITDVFQTVMGKSQNASSYL